jgi:hypothetical protein
LIALGSCFHSLPEMLIFHETLLAHLLLDQQKLLILLLQHISDEFAVGKLLLLCAEGNVVIDEGS